MNEPKVLVTQAPTRISVGWGMSRSRGDIVFALDTCLYIVFCSNCAEDESLKDGDLLSKKETRKSRIT